MSAVATPTSRDAKAARPTSPASAPAVPATTTRQQDRAWLADLAKALNAAANADCPHLYSGESDRLLGVAYEISARLATSSDAELDGPAGDESFTIASLVKAALQVPGDCLTAERLAFIEQARAPLVGLTDCATVLDGWETYPRTAAAAAEPEPEPARPRDWLSDALSKVGEARAVLRMLAEGSGTDPIWGLVRLADWLADEMQACADAEKAKKTACTDSAANIACVLSILYLVAEHDDHVLIHAAASLLEMAASYCESAQEAGHA
ncbi:hypothetical protein [Paracidovorax anthurii]|uniref:Uncharacterized protein n=1 Tax=Paracidovorax anthurii TaxID=78229 RepID=A0A328ZG90_9BURK|nr:hypothetical protein [Paracidovorax anthurii]RAR85001.1 hypothetical protein AX018_100894 [Paracidovorax anthurii]